MTSIWKPRAKSTIYNEICRGTWTGHEAGVCVVLELFDGRIASGSDDMMVRIWGTESEYTILRCSDSISSLCQLRDGRLVVGMKSGGKLIEIWNIDSLELEMTLEGHLSCVSAMLQWNIDPIYMFTCSYSGKIKMWDLQLRNCVSSLESEFAHSNKPIYTMIQVKDGRLVSGGNDSFIKIWKVGRAEPVMNIYFDKKNIQSPTDEPVLSFSNGFWSWECTVCLKGHENFVREMIQLKDDRLCSISIDNKVMIWDLRNSSTVTLAIDGRYTGNWKKTLVQLQDGAIAVSCLDNAIQVWKSILPDDSCTLPVTSKGSTRMTLAATLTGHSKEISKLILLSDGRLCSCSQDGSIKTWL